MALFSFGSGGGFGGKDKKDDVNIFSLNREDRQRQRELLARQERKSLIQIVMLGTALLVVGVMYFMFQHAGAKTPATQPGTTPGSGQNIPGTPAGHGSSSSSGGAKNADDGPDAMTLAKMMEQLESPDVRPTADQLAPDFEPLVKLDPAVLTAGIDETNLDAADAYDRNKPKPEAVAQALRYLRTHLETARDFKTMCDPAALPFAALEHPDAARGKFALLQGDLEDVEKEYCGYGYEPIDDAALAKSCGVKELHLYYFDVNPVLRGRFYFGDTPPVDTDPQACGVKAKLGKFAVLVPADLRPNFEANLAEIDSGGKPKVHMIFHLRMSGLFLGDHLVLQPKVGNSGKRVVVPLYLAIDPLPWRSDIDKAGNLGPKMKTEIVRAKPGAASAVIAPDPNGGGGGGDYGADSTAPAGATGAGGDGNTAKEGAFIPISDKFQRVEDLTGKEDAFDSIPTGNSIEEIKDASEYTHSFEAFHLIVRYFRSHTPEQIYAQMLKREEANMKKFNDGSKTAANFTNTVNNPTAYYGQPYNFEGWVVKCLNPRDFWEQDYGQESGEHANSGVVHTSTWLIRDDRVNFYCVTVPKSTVEILGPKFRGDLNNLTGLNMRVVVHGIFMQRMPIQKQDFNYDRVPFFVAMDLGRLPLAPGASMFYNYLIAAVFAVMILAVIVMIQREKKPDAVVRNRTRENMFKRLRQTGKLNKAPGEPINYARPVGNGTPPPAGAGPAAGAPNAPPATPPPAGSGNPPPAP